METVFIIAGLIGLSLALVLHLMATAPFGYEDETGWHPGEPRPPAPPRNLPVDR